MVLNERQMDQILKLLLSRTRDQKLMWYAEQGRIWHPLPNQTTIQLNRSENNPEVTMEIKGDSGEVLGHLRAESNDLLPALYDTALQSAGRSLFAEIVDSLSADAPAFWSTTSSPPWSAPPAPPQLASEQADAVLRKMAGKWELDFSRGKEKVSIDECGEYTIIGRSAPSFCLKVLAWNNETGTAEVAKDRPDGTRLQIEYLRITADAMQGHAKHDMHPLSYRRL